MQPNSSDTDTLFDDSDELLRMTGGLMIGHPGSEVIQGTLRSIKEHNLRHEVLNAEELRKRFPLFHVSPEEIGAVFLNLLNRKTIIIQSEKRLDFFSTYLFVLTYS